MKHHQNSFILSVVFLFIPFLGTAQVGYSPYVDSLANLADTSNMELLVRQLSGDTAVVINGQTHTFTTRFAGSTQNQLATEFIAGKFTEYGYTPEIQFFNDNTGQNVIATKIGSLYPDNYYIVSAHYDSYNYQDQEHAPGADDNASGTAAMLEAARLFYDIPSEYSIKFIAFDEEELGLYGSNYFASQASQSGMVIEGVINLDMLGYTSDTNYKYDLCTEDDNAQLALDFEASAGFYYPHLITYKDNCNGSDQYSFWLFGYPAIGVIEAHSDFNPHYHSAQDIIDNFNLGYYFSLAKAAYSTLLANILEYRYDISHKHLLSTNQTTPRLAEAVITGTNPIAQGNDAPRLYYSTDNINYESVLTFESVGDTFRFMIPGFPYGTVVNYYFAVQDENGNYLMTSPFGGMGFPPQASIPPSETYSYIVDALVSHTACSPNMPLPLPTSSTTVDEFTVTQVGRIEDLDVTIDITHTATVDLRVRLVGPDNTLVTLTDAEGGGGDNFTQTRFDDDADSSILEGHAPFTGHYRPLVPLSNFRNKYTDGIWKLSVHENNFYNPGGSLNSWCLHFFYVDTTVNAEHKNLQNLSFNCYPNPAKDKLEILFTVSELTRISLTIYNQTGVLVKTLGESVMPPGNNLLVTPIESLPSGIYFIRAYSDKQSSTRKLVVIK